MGVPFTKLSYFQQERLSGNGICSYQQDRWSGLFYPRFTGDKWYQPRAEKYFYDSSPSAVTNRNSACTQLPENCIVRKIIKLICQVKKGGGKRRREKKKDTDPSSNVSDGTNCNSPEGQHKLWLRSCPTSVDLAKATALLFFPAACPPPP